MKKGRADSQWRSGCTGQIRSVSIKGRLHGRTVTGEDSGEGRRTAGQRAEKEPGGSKTRQATPAGSGGGSILRRAAGTGTGECSGEYSARPADGQEQQRHREASGPHRGQAAIRRRPPKTAAATAGQHEPPGQTSALKKRSAVYHSQPTAGQKETHPPHSRHSQGVRRNQEGALRLASPRQHAP